MKILIPAYEPDNRLLRLIIQIQMATADDIIIVDDGSGKEYQNIFTSAQRAGCVVLQSPVNHGKGHALKMGFSYLEKHGQTDGVVCADCDGQHTAEDIMNVAVQLKTHRRCVVLGVRQFVGKVPLRSRVGNTLTRMIFSFVTGCKVQDTQTGLRGYSADMLPWLCSVEGSRFEYELNILLEAQQAGYSFFQLPIQTVYEQKNKSSHFRPVQDSVRVYLPILKFSASSLISAAIDFVLLLLVQAITNNLLVSAVTARMVSSIFNYLCNKNLVFKRGSSKSVSSAPKYFMLVLMILACNYLLLAFFTGVLLLPLVIAKIVTECVLFLFSYSIQKKYIFRIDNFHKHPF